MINQLTNIALANTFFDSSIFIIIALLLFFGAIVLGIVFFKRYQSKKNHEEKPKIDEKQAAKEELDRILEPINDQELEDQVANYGKDKEEKKKE